MKCVKTANGFIMRVKDKKARELVDNTNYYYCSKSEWKKYKKSKKKDNGYVTRKQSFKGI